MWGKKSIYSFASIHNTNYSPEIRQKVSDLLRRVREREREIEREREQSSFEEGFSVGCYSVMAVGAFLIAGLVLGGVDLKDKSDIGPTLVVTAVVAVWYGNYNAVGKANGCVWVLGVLGILLCLPFLPYFVLSWLVLIPTITFLFLAMSVRVFGLFGHK